MTQEGAQNTNYKLLLTLLRDFLDESTIDAIRLTNKAGYEFANETLAISKVGEATMLVENKASILRNAKMNVAKFFSKQDFERLNLRLSELERLLKNNKNNITDEVLEEVNTLIAASQVKLLNHIALTDITRFTSGFCEKLMHNVNHLNLIELEDLIIESEGLVMLSESIKDLKQLKNIAIYEGRLRHLPFEIGELSDLECLTVQQTALQDLPKSIGMLNNLIKLDVSMNQIKELNGQIRHCIKLQDLNLAHNQLQAIPSGLEFCSALKSLNCIGNPMLSELPINLNAKKISLDIMVLARWLAKQQKRKQKTQSALPFGITVNSNTLFCRGNFYDFIMNDSFIFNSEPLTIGNTSDSIQQQFLLTNAQGQTDAAHVPSNPDSLVFVHDPNYHKLMTKKKNKMK